MHMDTVVRPEAVQKEASGERVSQAMLEAQAALNFHAMRLGVPSPISPSL